MFHVVSVEDNDEIAELLCVVLEHPQVTVHLANTGEEGLALIRAKMPDLVILDVVIHGERSGWDVYDTVRSEPDLAHIPVVMLSVDRENAERRRAFAGSEIDAYMTKPFDALRLRRVVGRLLGHEKLWTSEVDQTKPADPA